MYWQKYENNRQTTKISLDDLRVVKDLATCVLDNGKEVINRVSRLFFMEDLAMKRFAAIFITQELMDQLKEQ